MKKQRSLKSQRKLRNRPHVISTEQSYELDMRFATAYLASLIDDALIILRGHYSVTDATRDRARLIERITKEGLSFATKTLPSYFSAFLARMECGRASFPQFKLKRGMCYPVLMHRLCHLAECSGDQHIRGKAFDILYSICCAFKKLKGTYSERVLKSQWLDFVEVDRGLADIDWFESVTYFILHYARECFRGFFQHADITSCCFSPQPGPGATNTPTEKTSRYAPHVLYDQIDRVLPYQEWFFPTPWHACLQSRNFIKLYESRVEAPVSRFKQVPKTYGKARGICIEENEMQVLQQAFRKGINSLIKRYKWLDICLPLEDQRVNARLALDSSRTGDNGTIDMSEASDRVARELVSWISQDTPLHDPLMALSTKFVEPPKLRGVENQLIRTNKYAPMGSGLCFPIMSLIHLFLIWGIFNYAFPEQPDLWKSVRVYGDDIVVPSHTVEKIYEHLPRFGMKLNTMKSFYRCGFRESCGVHAYQGMDVTPVYVKYTPNHNDPKRVISGVAVEAQLYKKGFYTTATLFRDRMNMLDSIPTLHHQSFASIRRDALDDFVLNEQKRSFEKRWNSDYQCYEYKVSKILKKSLNRKFGDDESPYLRRLWTDHLPSNIYKDEKSLNKKLSHIIGDSYGDLSVRSMWVPESAL